jgi:hypothetical protein
VVWMPPTLRGIYHNLKESEYTISNSEIVFFFSSELYLRKFMEGYKENRIKFIEKLDKITVDNKLNMNTLADITLYKTIEKRGFRAWLKGVDIDWQEIHKYALRKMTEKNTPDWSRIPKPKLGERLKTLGQ